MKYCLKEEPQARVKYIEATKNHVREIGMKVYNDYPFLGTSPDGLIMHNKDVVGILEAVQIHYYTWRGGGSLVPVRKV